MRRIMIAIRLRRALRITPRMAWIMAGDLLDLNDELIYVRPRVPGSDVTLTGTGEK